MLAGTELPEGSHNLTLRHAHGPPTNSEGIQDCNCSTRAGRVVLASWQREALALGGADVQMRMRMRMRMSAGAEASQAHTQRAAIGAMRLC